MDYVQATWLPLKEKFVEAWTDLIPHYGHIATSRGEGAHANLKQWLPSSQGDLGETYKAMVRLCTSQRIEISQKIALNRMKHLNELGSNFLWSNVTKKISHFALKKVPDSFLELHIL